FAREHEATHDLLFGLQDSLYAAGARLFLYIDVPPIARTPTGAKALANDPSMPAAYYNWNISLRRRIEAFANEHRDARIFTFSSFDCFSRLLDTYADHGFVEEDLYKAGGAIWKDHLHPRSAVHKIFARDLVQFLRSQQ
ncbi:unnamed protein product, partial [Mycena citricolor]